MATSERNETGWESAAAVAAPAALVDLERRVDEAVAIARASEAAIMTVGAAAFDAADQALRAAELAERASAAMLGERSAQSAVPLFPPEPAAGEIRVSATAPPAATQTPLVATQTPLTAIQTPPPAIQTPLGATQMPPAMSERPGADLDDELLRGFRLRADRLASRLHALG